MKTLMAALASDGERGPKRTAATALALGAVSFLLYLPSLRFGFVAYDDLRIVLDHPNLYDERSLLRSLHEIFVGYFPREEPLLVRDVSWALDSRLFGFANPFGYHLGNVLLNAANAGLLFLFLLRATSRYRFAALVAGLFALLPVHVEAVCWVMGRKDVLCAFFVLLVLLAEAHAARSADRGRRRWLRVLAFVLYPLAILAKFGAVSLVLVLGLYRVFAPTLLDRRDPPRVVVSDLISLMPHLLVSVGIFVWYNHVLSQFGVIGPPAGVTAEHLGTLARFIPLVIGLYAASVLGITDRSITYLTPNEAIPLTALERGLSLATALALVAFFAWAVRRRRDLLFFGLAFLALLLPYFNIVSVILWRADRYLYLASFCLLAIAVALVLDLLPYLRARSRRIVPLVMGATAVWALFAALVTLAREPAFRDNHALWTHEVSLARPAVVAFQALARSFLGRAGAEPDPEQRAVLLAQAERVARDGLRYYEGIPWHPGAGARPAPRLDYANLHVQLGRVASARGEPLAVQIGHYRRSYAVAPTNANTLLLAQALFEQAAAGLDQAGARESLRYYGEYIGSVRADRAHRTHATEVLDGQYLRVFPALASTVETIKRTALR
jgi:hypothetical protein